MSDSVGPQREQPTRLHRPWDSPGKNTGVGLPLPSPMHESESEVTRQIGSGQTGDGKSERRQSRNRQTKMDWNG